MNLLQYADAIPSTETHTMPSKREPAPIMEWDRLPLMLTPGQVAAILQINWRTVVNMCARDEIHARKIAGNWRIPRDELMRLVAVDPRRATP